jgi:hypothetical protein
VTGSVKRKTLACRAVVEEEWRLGRGAKALVEDTAKDSRTEDANFMVQTKNKKVRENKNDDDGEERVTCAHKGMLKLGILEIGTMQQQRFTEHPSSCEQFSVRS